jgi:type VII secretion-associated serine protease mycosin
MLSRFAQISMSTLLTASVHASALSGAPTSEIRSSQWFLAYLNIPQVHAVSTGAGIIVGLPDSGVDPHPDLKLNLLKGIDTIPGGDGIGHVDQLGHGTQMAGLIAAHGQKNAAGALGVAPAAKLLPAKVSGSTDTEEGLGAAIAWAAEKGARVINVSSGSAPSDELEEAIRAAAASSALIVAAAGNREKYPFMQYPASYDGVLAVGAIDRQGKHAEFSVRDAKISLCAPGVEIVTTGRNASYRDTDGTSGATAIVSGAAALVRSKFPELSAREVIHRLTATATDIGPPGRDDECGFGVLNIVKALTAEVPPLGSTANPSTAPSRAVTPSTSEDASMPAAESPRPDSGGAALLAVVSGGAAIIAIGTLLAFVASRRRRQPQ